MHLPAKSFGFVDCTSGCPAGAIWSSRIRLSFVGILACVLRPDQGTRSVHSGRLVLDTATRPSPCRIQLHIQSYPQSTDPILVFKQVGVGGLLVAERRTVRRLPDRLPIGSVACPDHPASRLDRQPMNVCIPQRLWTLPAARRSESGEQPSTTLTNASVHPGSRPDLNLCNRAHGRPGPIQGSRTPGSVMGAPAVQSSGQPAWNTATAAQRFRRAERQQDGDECWRLGRDARPRGVRLVFRGRSIPGLEAIPDVRLSSQHTGRTHVNTR